MNVALAFLLDSDPLLAAASSSNSSSFSSTSSNDSNLELDLAFADSLEPVDGKNIDADILPANSQEQIEDSVWDDAFDLLEEDESSLRLA